jgi:hypothetical protein
VKFGLLILLTGAAALVWVFAIIGITTVARAAFPETPPAPQVSLLDSKKTDGDVPGVEIGGLPRYPGSVRSEFRETTWSGATVAEAEYRTQDPVAAVLRHYRTAFHAAGWTLDGQTYEMGEHVYAVTLGDQRATVEIERLGSDVEVEIELVRPAWPRGSVTTR